MSSRKLICAKSGQTALNDHIRVWPLLSYVPLGKCIDSVLVYSVLDETKLKYFYRSH
jgi:hypothetical protein